MDRLLLTPVATILSVALEATVYEAAPLADALNERMSSDPTTELTVVLHGSPLEWDFDAWPMAPIVERWGARGRAVAVSVDAGAVAGADAVTRRRIALWIERARAHLRNISAAERDLLAVTNRGDRATAWRSLDSAAYGISATWASTSTAPVVRGPIELAGQAVVPIDSRSLLVERVRESIFEMDNEIDGPASGFGQRLRRAMMTRNEALATVFEEPCLELTYSDRYLFSPLVARLVTEFLAGFANVDTIINVDTLIQRRDGRRPRAGRTLRDDWPDVADRDMVLRHMLASIAPTARLRLHQHLPHRRRLEFRSAKGAGTIFFDQGVGSWTTQGVIAFDPMASTQAQLAAIQVPFVVENGPNGTFFAVRLD